MSARTSKVSAGYGRGPWPAMLALLLAVLVPTACVLWFMIAAMDSERLAVRQRLADLYRQRALTARAALEQHLGGKFSALAGLDGKPAAVVFADLVRAKVAPAVVVYDVNAEVAYPADHDGRPMEAPQEWHEAVALEYDDGKGRAAAEAYAKIAAHATDMDLKARALQGQARSLIRAGQEDDALAVLTGPICDASLRNAADEQGRLIVPGARLLALRLLKGRGDTRFAAHCAALAKRLRDYTDAAISSSQRRFLMRALGEMDPAATPDTLAAEELAAEYLAHPRGTAPRGRFARAEGPGRHWHTAGDAARVVAVFREEDLISELISAGRLKHPPAGAAFKLVPPRGTEEKADAFVTIPAAAQLPGWQLQVHIVGENIFAAAAQRQRAVYLWTGALGIGAIIVLAAVAARYLGRQMKLTRLKNDLIATVSHELKTPLASMRVLVDTLLAGRVRDEKQTGEYLQLLASENERLSRLIDNFLTFSRMERNKRAFELVALDPADIVAAAVHSAGERFCAADCRLDVDVADGLPAIVGDRDALTTVLLNLLDNAHKYSEARKHISIRAFEADGWVCFAVADRGMGISRRAARRIFDRFYQVDLSLSRGAGGCGLGLSIVQFIVDAHGGLVEVDSEVGTGSTFTVKLHAAGADFQQQ